MFWLNVFRKYEVWPIVITPIILTNNSNSSLLIDVTKTNNKTVCLFNFCISPVWYLANSHNTNDFDHEFKMKRPLTFDTRCHDWRLIENARARPIDLLQDQTIQYRQALYYKL